MADKKNKKNKKNKIEQPQISLRNILAMQCKVAGFDFEEDGFSDGSGSWVEVKGNVIMKDDELFRYDFVISFDGAGDNITAFKIFKTPYKINEDESEQIFP